MLKENKEVVELKESLFSELIYFVLFTFRFNKARLKPKTVKHNKIENATPVYEHKFEVY